MPSYLSHLECPKCGRSFDADRIANLCPHCSAPLLVRYDLPALRERWRPSDLAGRPATLWRYFELLPVRAEENVVSLGEGMTPLWAARRLGEVLGLADLWIKDEGLCPTGTFKARGAATGVSKAKELGIRSVAMPTNGNAGGAWAAYGARAGIEVILCMPVDAPLLAQQEAHLVGARCYQVRGQITDAGKIIAAGAKKHGWFEAATLKEPYRIEGKKTMGLEIAEQFGWQLPDAILYPTGGGVGIIGIYKALLELEALGWVRRPFPKLVAVQAAGCAPIVKAYAEGKADSVLWENAATVAQGIRVPKALGDFLVLEAVRATGGTCIAVDDAATLTAFDQVAKREGAFICPEGAAAVAAAAQLRQSGFLRPDERVVVLNTGAGLKYPDLVSPQMPVLAIDAEI